MKKTAHKFRRFLSSDNDEGKRANMVEPETTKGHSPGKLSTEALHQRRKFPYCPMRMAVGGFAATVVLGYFVLYSKKKPEASAADVAKVATGVAKPENTRPQK